MNKLIALAAAVASLVAMSRAQANEKNVCEVHNMHTHFIAIAEDKTYLAFCSEALGYKAVLGNYNEPKTTVVPITTWGDGYFEGKDDLGNWISYDPGCSPDNQLNYCPDLQPPSINFGTSEQQHHFIVTSEYSNRDMSRQIPLPYSALSPITQ